MGHSLDEIARATGLALVGDGSLRVGRPAHPAAAGADDLAVAMHPDYQRALKESPCRAALVWPDADLADLGLEGALIAPRARVAMAAVTAQFQPVLLDLEPGVHPAAVVDPSAEIAAGAAIGPLAVIGAHARIGADARIADHVSVGAHAHVGDRAVLHAGVRIGAKCHLGADVVVHQNAVIGADGFSFEPTTGSVKAQASGGGGTGAPERVLLRIHSLAAVEIGDQVEIGASTTIDRGTLAPTRIGRGTKIDNLVQIGHNVQIGETCLLCAQVGLAGSVEIGDRVVLGGKVGIGDHIQVGHDVISAAGALVATNIRPGTVIMGIPATKREKAMEEIVAIKRLPRALKQLAELRQRMGL